MREDGKPHPFQITMRRFGRTRDVKEMQRQIPLVSFFFDILYLDGEPLFDMPYRKRFELLTETIQI